MSNALIGSLRVSLGLDTAAFEKGISDSMKSLKGIGKSMQSMGATLSTYVTLPLLGIGTASIKAAGEAEQATESVRAALKSMGEGAGYSLDQLQKMAAGLQSVSTFDDDDIMSKVTANMLTFGNVTGDVFARAQQSALNLSARLGTDLQSSAIMLGKALNDPIKGVSALTRVGVSFTAQQKDQIKAMAEVGNLAGAQAMILGELEKQYGGQALAQSGTVLGQQAQAWNAIGDAMEDVGAAILPVIAELAGHVKTAAEAFSALSPEMKKWIVIVGGSLAAGGPVLIGLGLLAAALGTISIPAVLVAGSLVLITWAVIKLWPEIVKLGEVIGQFVSDKWEKFKAAMANAGEVLDSLKNGIMSFLSDAWAKFESAWDGIVAKVDSVKDSIVQFAAEIPGIFADLAAQMVEIGAQIIQGLWDGLKSKMSAVRDSLTGFASGLVDSVRSTLGIQSPSTVMAEIGSFIMQGLGLGMQQQQAAVVGVATDTANQVADAWAGMRDVTKDIGAETANSFDGIFKSLGSDVAGLIKGTKDWRDVLLDIGDQLIKIMSSTGSGGTGGSSGGIGGFLSSLLGGLTGFASGGTIMAGGTGGIDSQLVAFRKSPTEQVDITKPGQTSSGGNTHVTFGVSADNNGNLMPFVESVSQRTAGGVVQAGLSKYDSALPSRFGDIMERNG